MNDERDEQRGDAGETVRRTAGTEAERIHEVDARPERSDEDTGLPIGIGQSTTTGTRLGDGTGSLDESGMGNVVGTGNHPGVGGTPPDTVTGEPAQAAEEDFERGAGEADPTDMGGDTNYETLADESSG
jgi:hypothetical protein